MAESSVEKPKLVQNQAHSKSSEIKIGTVDHIAAGADASPPPLDSAAIARIQCSPRSALRSDVLALQRTVGNRAVAALVRGETKEVGIQAKLEVGPVNDQYEQEADRIARVVTSGIAQRKPTVNTKPRGEAHKGLPIAGAGLNIKCMVQRKGAATQSNVRDDGSFTADASIHERVRRMESGGKPLADSVRQQMEPGFGSDLSQVRIHTGGDAVQLSQDIGARAFTHGTHIAFGAGHYNPNSQQGRHLLAHELTHTIQQTGARPLASAQRSPTVRRSPTSEVRRGPKSLIQRGIIDSMRSFFSRSKVEAPPEPDRTVPGTAPQIQAAALAKAIKARGDAESEVAKAKGKADTSLSKSGVSEDMKVAQKGLGGEEILGGLKTVGAKGGGYESGVSAIKGMGAGDEARKKFLTKFREDLEAIRVKIQDNVDRIMLVNDEINAPVKQERHKINEGRKAKAFQSHAYAEESVQLAESINKQVEEMDRKADVEGAVATTGLDDFTNFNKSRSLPAAEKSASDSVLSMNRIEDKVKGHVAYLQADLAVLKEYVMEKQAHISGNSGVGTALRALNSGMERATTPGNHRPLNTDQVTSMSREQEQDLAMTDSEIGKLHAQSNVSKNSNPESQGAKKLHKAKSKLPKAKAEKAKKVSDLEIAAMLLARAEKRIDTAQPAVTGVSDRQKKTMAIYEELDKVRSTHKKSQPSQSVTDNAIIRAGEARKYVAESTVFLALTYRLKTEVYNESQKARYASVGPRAQSKTKRRLKKLGAMVGNVGARVLTGGLVGMQSQDTAGGYRVEVKKQTLLDDIDRKSLELVALVEGLNGEGRVRGLGGKHGARAYIFFKMYAFLMQIVRDIASGVALWVTILTAGAGAPVGAIFATIALYAAIVKGIIDLLLFSWSGAGLFNTNDPRSRSILRGENRNQMIAVGEGLLTGGTAGLAMGVSGNDGILTGAKQATAFSDPLLSGGVDIGIKAGGNIGQNVLANNVSRYNPEQSIEGRRIQHAIAQVRRAKGAMGSVSAPINSGFTSLSDFVAKKQKLRDSRLGKIAPRVTKSVQTMDKQLQGIPENEGAQSAAAKPPRTPPPLPPRVRKQLSSEVEPPEVIPSGPPSMPSPLSESEEPLSEYSRSE